MLYWVKLCIIFIGILPCFTLWSCQYLMFYSLITPFWAQQYYASKLYSQQNKKFLKYTKEPYASSRTWKINNILIYVCSWAPLVCIGVRSVASYMKGGIRSCLWTFTITTSKLCVKRITFYFALNWRDWCWEQDEIEIRNKTQFTHKCHEWSETCPIC